MAKTDREGENVMQALFDAVNAICGKIQVVSDLFWEFPTNFGWYAAIPILGNFSLAIILLVGTGKMCIRDRGYTMFTQNNKGRTL